MSTSNDSGRDSQDRKAVKEMEEELERWKIEVRELRQDRVATDGWRKQISDLERDLETALDSLQSAEAKVIELRSEQQSAAACKKVYEDAQEKLTAYEATVQQLKAEIELVRGEKEKALEDAATNQKEQLAQLESSNQGNFKQLTMAIWCFVQRMATNQCICYFDCIELEQKLTLAQQEIEQLELQAAPPEVQEVQQALFSATQDLEESKLLVEKLKAELAEEKAKIAREQEDAGQLLVKLSQLQDTIA
jgi:chromosome segregation ATPase